MARARCLCADGYEATPAPLRVLDPASHVGWTCVLCGQTIGIVFTTGAAPAELIGAFRVGGIEALKAMVATDVRQYAEVQMRMEQQRRMTMRRAALTADK